MNVDVLSKENEILKSSLDSDRLSINEEYNKYAKELEKKIKQITENLMSAESEVCLWFISS